MIASVKDPNICKVRVATATPQSDSKISVARAIAKMLETLKIKKAFGISGGAIAPIWNALESSYLDVFHFRHEAGAAFAAIEAYFASGEPIVIFTTAGPGLTNVLTGLFAARWEGAKVIFISPATSASQRGRFAFQETSAYTMPLGDIFSAGKLFDFAATLESAAELPGVYTKLAKGLNQLGGFVAHLSLPCALQTEPTDISLPEVKLPYSKVTARKKAIAHCADLLQEDPFAIWVGFGARGAAKQIRKLAERTGAPVICSPRAKGIFPEDHPLFVGVTGFGGHRSVLTYMQEYAPRRILVVGTRLGEFTSFWDPTLVPERGFIHVDINPEAFGAAYPEVETLAMQSDAKVFLKRLLECFPKDFVARTPASLPQSDRDRLTPQLGRLVRPQMLMQGIQQVIVEKSKAVIMAEAGTSFAWATHHLRFQRPRYRVSTSFGSMGHAVTGVVGAALAAKGKAVAIVGDGAMLMNSEVNTAVKYGIPAVWIVLNDGEYNLCSQGMASLGFNNVDAALPLVDFVLLARSMGAKGIRVTRESEIVSALEEAMTTIEPCIIDVRIDPAVPAPIGNRINSLMAQGAGESNSKFKK